MYMHIDIYIYTYRNLLSCGSWTQGTARTTTHPRHSTPRSALVSHNVFLNLFRRSQLPNKCVNLSFTIGYKKD